MNQHISYANQYPVSDIELEIDDLSMESFDDFLSERDENLLLQINELQKDIDGGHDLMKDLWDAVKKGAMDYVDSMTDTGESFCKMKDSEAVGNLNEVEIDKRMKPAYAEVWQTRKMAEAKTNPFDKNVSGNTSGMSDDGKAKFARYQEAYRQRQKSNKVCSNGQEYKVATSDPMQNYESLSGLRNYRIGPVVPMPDIETVKRGYNESVAAGKTISPAGYIRKVNFEAFDQALKEKFGFASKSAAAKWRESNHLTIHETGEGMFLVPSDVHDSASHKAYCSKLRSILVKEEGAEQAMQDYIREERMAYIKHEARERGIRVGKGVAMSVVKDVLKHFIANVVTELLEQRQLIKELGVAGYVKSVFINCWKKVKAKAVNILKNIGANISGAILTEFLNALNDFVFGTFKRIFSVIRQMFGSIKSAFKIICDRNKPWQERIYEAVKILSAGAVALLGFSLNELILKGLMTIHVPESIASFVAEVMSGLFAGIFSNIVLMLFDHTKHSMKVRNTMLQQSLLRSQSLFIDNLRIEVNCIQTRREVYDTCQFYGKAVNKMVFSEKHIKTIEERITTINDRTIEIVASSVDFSKLKNKFNDDNF